MSRTGVKHRALSDHGLFSEPAPVVVPSDGANNPEMATRRGLARLGQRVLHFRNLKGWNRTTLARKAGITVTTLRGCEDATKVTQPDKLRRIAKALGLTPQRLEADEADTRVQHWNDEDYEIGAWFHNAPRQLKNRIWALQELTETGRALLDPQFVTLLEGWTALTDMQKASLLNMYEFFRRKPAAEVTPDGGGGIDALAATDPKVRGPHR